MNVIVNGTFDLFHPGHLKLLEYAKNCVENSNLIVLIDSDNRIKQLKGHKRPIFNQNDRVELIKSLRIVDSVFMFNTDDELINLIKSHTPAIMVKGDDYMNKFIIGKELCDNIIFYKRDQYASSDIIERIINW